jgi:outer membrane lipoprotein-sorting protein
VVEALEVKDIQGHPTVTRSKVTDLKSGGHTVSEFSDIKYDVGLPESVFTERYLRRAPRRYLR